MSMAQNLIPTKDTPKLYATMPTISGNAPCWPMEIFAGHDGDDGYVRRIRIPAFGAHGSGPTFKEQNDWMSDTFVDGHLIQHPWHSIFTFADDESLHQTIEVLVKKYRLTSDDGRAFFQLSSHG